MIRQHSRSGKRSAFTLIELMVVILIISILVSLITVVGVKALGKVPEVQTRTEISEMDTALRAFMLDYNLSDPPPSYLVLYDDVTQYALSPLPGAGPSYQFLQKTFGKNIGTQGFISWSGANTGGTGVWILEGEQCLVFYLGGIANQGFSTNNANPTPITGKRTHGPYFSFQTARLVPGSSWNANLNGFPVYVDQWQVKNPPQVPGGLPGVSHPLGTPYAYFSTNGINNGYGPANCASLYPAGYAAGNPVGYTPAVPYGTGSGYTNSNTYQIISAGRDGVFGTGLWNPASGATGNGADDQANFSGSLLGSPQS